MPNVWSITVSFLVEQIKVISRQTNGYGKFCTVHIFHWDKIFIKYL